MSKLGQFAAAGVAVLCAFGVFAVEQVSPGSGDDAAAIAAAIAAAAGEGGDGVVQLASGTYTLASTVTIDQPVTVKGVLASSTIITSSGSAHSLFKLTNADAVLANVTLTGATASTGAGVTVTAGTVQDSIISGNKATSGGNAGAGVWLSGANSALRRCRVENNTTSGYGGGVYHTGAVTIESCLITGNSASWGGGLYGENSAAVAVVSHCNIYSNSGPQGGADIYDYSQSTLNTYYYCYFGSAIVQKKSNTQIGCVVGGAISEDTLKGKANPITDQPKLANLDMNGAPFNPTKPSVGCVEYDVVDVEADFSPSGAVPGTTVSATVSYRNLPEGATVSTELFDVDGAVVGGSPTGGDFTFTTGTRPGDYTLVVTLKVGGVERQIRSTPFYCGYSTVHVSTTGSGTAPYGTEETGLTDIQAAIASCAPGATVIVHDGTYELDEPVVLERAITVRSANGREKTTLKPASDKNIRLAYLNHAEALLDGFTMTSGRSASVKYGNTASGGGVLIDTKGGTVDNCIVERCSSSGHGGQASVRSAQAVIRRTILRDGLEASGTWGAVYASGKGGFLDNCIVSGNTHAWGAGIYVEVGSRLAVVNCTVAGNKMLANTSGNTSVVYADGSGRCYCTNCILQQCQGSTVSQVNSISANGRRFKDAANNDYSLLVEDTAAIDKGLALDDVLATDVYGRKRVSGEAIDIGAAEFQAEVLGVEFARNKKSGLFGTDASFVLTPTVTGASGPVTLTWLITCDHGRRTILNAETSDEPLVFEPETPGSFTVKLTADDGSGEPVEIEKVDYVVAGASEVFVDVAGGNAFPYLTAETAAHDFNDVWAFVTSGSVVRVAAGCYRTAKTLDLSVPIQVVGAGRDVTTIRLMDGVNGRVVTLNHARSLVRGCTLSGGRLGEPSGSNGCGVKFEANGGAVEDCRITDNRRNGYGQHGGGVAFAKGSKGVLRRSVVDNNVADSNYGGGIYTPGGGVVENCLVISNMAAYGGGIYLDVGAALYVTNCTVVGNSSNMGAGIYLWNPGNSARFVNTIVRPQLGVAIGDEDSTNGMTKVFSHCAIEKLYRPKSGAQYAFPEVNGNTHVVPEFVNAAAGDYHLKRKSPLRKAGLVTPSLKKQTDLDGRPRVSNGVVDIGCYQTLNGGLTLILR